MKVTNLLRSSGKLDRIRSLFEIRINQIFWRTRPHHALNFRDALLLLPAGVQSIILSGEADNAVGDLCSLFDNLLAENDGTLPLPSVFNADKSLAVLIYSFIRYLKADVVLESGVGYGIASGVALLAMERNGRGSLYSVDLPSLADPDGAYTGVVIPVSLRKRWQLRLGSSRKLLPELSKKIKHWSLFISDSANVFTLQKYEFDLILPMISPRGILIFNNISAKFKEYIDANKGITAISIWQLEKPGCVTALVMKSQS